MARKKTKEETEAVLLRSPPDRTFYQVIAFSLCALGLNSQVWPWYDMPKNKLLRFNRLAIMFGEPITTVSQIFFFYMNYKEYTFAELTVMLTIIPICCNIAVDLVIAQTKTYKNFLVDFMAQIHLHNLHIKDPENKYVKECLLTVERYSKYTFYIFSIGRYLSSITWAAVSIRHNFVNNPDLQNITHRLEAVIHIWLPFDYEFNFNNWLFVETVSIYCTVVGIFVLFIFDFFMLSCIYHFLGHIKIFMNKLKTGLSVEKTQDEIKSYLIELFVDYNWIKVALIKLEGCYGWYIVYLYIQNLAQGGILLYIFTARLNLDTLLTYGLMIPYLQGYLIFLSYILEYIRILADDIPSLVYELPWEDMSVRNQKMVWMLLCRVQPTLQFKAACNTKTGVQPALNIIKTTFSYYVMIKARNEV